MSRACTFDDLDEVQPARGKYWLKVLDQDIAIMRDLTIMAYIVSSRSTAQEMVDALNNTYPASVSE